LSSLKTETLRRSAENTMHTLVRTVFSRLHSLDPRVEEEKLLAADEDAPDAEIRMTMSTTDTDTQTLDENSQEIILEPQENLEGPEADGRTPSTAATIARPECMCVRYSS
jgi:brefeldin A-resistance guanine nucleotide exchange factor 1